MFKRCFWVAFIFLPLGLYAQTGHSRRAGKLIDKGEFMRAHDQVEKALEKDSSDARAWYQLARLFYRDGVSEISKTTIDSAHYCILHSLSISDTLSLEAREAYQKGRFATTSIDSLAFLIDSTAFRLTSMAMTEPAFEDFVQRYSLSVQCPQAVLYRDSLAFSTAREIHSWQAYLDFLRKYPLAREVQSATQLYEKLYYEESTHAETLLSYSAFLSKNPHTPYRYFAEKNILQIMTVLNEPEAYLNFIRLYPDSPWASKARNLLFYLLSQPELTPGLMTDSLRDIRAMNASPWLAVARGTNFMFIDLKGNERTGLIQSSFHLPCETLQTDFILLNNAVYGRNGTLILDGPVESIDDAGVGLLIYKKNHQVGAIHKSGMPVLRPVYDSMRLIDEKFIAFEQNGQWGLATLTGRILLSPAYDDIYNDQGMVFLENDNRLQPLNDTMIRDLANHEKVSMDFAYTTYKFLGDRLLMSDGRREVLMDDDLLPIIGPGKFILQGFPGVYLIRQDSSTEWVTADLLQKYSTARPVPAHNQRYALLGGENGMAVFDMYQFRILDRMDSAVILGNGFVLAFRQQEAMLFHRGGDPVHMLPVPEEWKVIGSGQAEYLFIKQKRKSLLYDADGKVLREGYFTVSTAITDSVMVCIQQEKRGLIHGTGQVLLQAEYDAIGNFDGYLLALLKNGKISAYDLANKKNIPASSDKRLVRLHEGMYLGERGGKAGVSDEDGKVIIPYSFDQIKYWNDTATLVKTANEWQFFKNGSGIMDYLPMNSLDFVRLGNEDQEVIALTGNEYSVLNSSKGIILPPEYEDIRNIGTVVNPVYITAKMVEEGGFYLITWYDSSGGMITRQTADENMLELLFCY